MNKRLLATLIIGFSIVLFTAGAAQAQARMTKEKLLPLLGKPGVYVVDVRKEADWDPSELKIKDAVREDPADVDS